ncbi:MAG: hypothetical protein ABIH37_04305 [archaeon]
MEETESVDYWLQKMKSLRYDWKDEIPVRILHSDSRIKSKARKGWFVGIRANGEEINNLGLMGKASFQLYGEYLEHYETEWIHRNTKPEDIEQGNRVLDSIIQDLELAK